jgi:uncharacterized membrane protein YsdA (DUF1294 family)
MDILLFLHSRLAAFSLGQIALYLLLINVLTFALYGADKQAAIRQGSRVPENVLHLFALAGGTPAAWAAQRHFRHKTRKGGFQALFWVIAAAQVALIGALVWLP